jgi:hypothetical protein
MECTLCQTVFDPTDAANPVCDDCMDALYSTPECIVCGERIIESQDMHYLGGWGCAPCRALRSLDISMMEVWLGTDKDALKSGASRVKRAREARSRNRQLSLFDGVDNDE